MSNYTNPHGSELDSIQNRVTSTIVFKADSYASRPVTKQAECAGARDAFISDPSEKNAAQLLRLQREVDDAATLAAAIADAGGPDELRARALRTPEVFDLF